MKSSNIQVCGRRAPPTSKRNTILNFDYPFLNLPLSLSTQSMSCSTRLRVPPTDSTYPLASTIRCCGQAFIKAAAPDFAAAEAGAQAEQIMELIDDQVPWRRADRAGVSNV